MAGEATIGALRVILGADTAKFEDNLKSAIGSLEDFGKKALTIATGINLANIFEQAFHGVVDSITGAIDAADKLSKASAKFGVPVETLAALSQAAALSEVSVEELGASFSKLSRSALAAGNITSDQASAFRALHVSVKDSSGEVKSLDTLILQIGDSISKVRNPTVAAQLAIAAFGKAGADMLPIFAQGAQGIKDLQERVQLLEPNLAADSEAAQHLKDNITSLTKAKELLVLRILGESGVLRAIEQTTAGFVEMTSDGEKLSAVVTKISDAVRVAAVGWDLFTTALKTAIIPTTTFFNALVQIASGNFALAFETLKDGAKAFADNAVHAGTAIKDLATGAVDFTYVGLSDELIKSVLALGKLNDVKFDPEFDKKLKAFNDQLEKMHANALDTSNVFAGQLAPGFLSAAVGMEILKGQIKLTADGLVTLGPLAQKFNDQLLQLQGVQLTQSLVTPFQQYQVELQKTQLLLQGLHISLDTFDLQNQKLAGNLQIAYTTAFDGVAKNAASAFKDLASLNHDWAAAAKAAAIAEATISAILGAQKAYVAGLTFGIPFAVVAAGVAAAAGAANLAKIIATPFAKGGSFVVPGGANARDSHMVPLALSSGERVDITPAGQAGGGRPREIVLSGIGPRDFFSGEMLRGLVDALNQGQRDGYRLKVAK